MKCLDEYDFVFFFDFWIIVILIVILCFTVQNNNIDEIVDKEININLKKLNHDNYVWKNNENYYNLKKVVRGCNIDNRKSFPIITKAYKNNSPTKNKEILNIVKEYLELDNKY